MEPTKVILSGFGAWLLVPFIHLSPIFKRNHSKAVNSSEKKTSISFNLKDNMATFAVDLKIPLNERNIET